MLELNTDTFEQTINSAEPVVVDFWADWCMPCKIFAPVLEELSDELDGKARFCKVNIDDCAGLAQKYDVAMIPTVIIFKNGEAEDRMVGVKPKSELMDALMKHIDSELMQ